MNQRSQKVRVLACVLVGLLYAGVFSQSLTNKLSEEESFYLNFGKDSYTKLKIERDVIGLYDFFGEHIVDGVHLYDLSGEAEMLSSGDVQDSVNYSKSNETAKKDFYQKFSNLVVTQDAIGGLKTSFVIGDQITTKFTPLTFNKTNFNGIRWDLWSTGLKFSFLLSRTRPGYMATNDNSGEALVEYPITDASLPSEYYGRGIRGDKDFSNKSPFGDYDLLWALHAENTIASKFDVGLTYINHHVADVKKTNVNPFTGSLPDSLMPKSVHFEFYDATPEDTLDAGVFVESMRMLVNGEVVKARPGFTSQFRRAFVGDKDGILLPRELPMVRPQNGDIPIIVEFKVDPAYWVRENGKGILSIKDIKKLSFEYTVAGNYKVFVSTDRQIPTNIAGQFNPQTRKVDYNYPTRSVGQIYDDGARIDQSGQFGNPLQTNGYSATYFGTYVCQSPRLLRIADSTFSKVISQNGYKDPYNYNYRVNTYDFEIPVSSVTYGFNFKGEFFGVNLSGEFALNQSEGMLPGRNESRKVDNKWVGTLKAKRDLTKSIGINAEVYQIAPQWNTAVEKFQSSEYFNQTSYKQELLKKDANGTPTGKSYLDYAVHPRPLGDQYNTIDDNDDNDAFPESDRRHYPADFNATDDQKFFMKDGSLSLNSDTLIGVNLPSRMRRAYDDPDGVVASKNDKNKNGTPDYMEDFLLFSSDPPVFELGVDLNNNGIPDYEDDDILPDYGHSVGYVVTGDGIKTLGVRGANFGLQWTPFDNTVVEIGAVLEGVLDKDFVLTTTGVDEDTRNFNGRSIVGYLTVKRNVIKRQQGLQYEIGNEIRIIKDEIRNDAIQSEINRINDAIDVNYWYYTDPLDYRQAIVDNFVAGVNYVNIPDLEYGMRVKLGGELHMPLTDSTYFPAAYENQWRAYPERKEANFHFVNRVKYSIHTEKQFEDWRSAFNFINRIEIIPEYKLQFSLIKEISGPDESLLDPRDDASMTNHRKYDVDGNGIIDPILDDYSNYLLKARGEREKWNTYDARNKSYLLNVPILRANFKIAENTQLQFGTQWLRYFDMISSENNSLKFTGLAQIVSSAQYKGYSVIFYLGGKWYNEMFDVHDRDAVLQNGSKFDKKGYQFFAKLYSGI